jgi:ADP-ribose pyrophosphatase
MNSPLERHEVRLRGLGGPAVCGIPGTCASATGYGARISYFRTFALSHSVFMSDEQRPRPWEVLGQSDEGDFEIFRARRVRARSPRDGEAHTFHIADAADGVLVLALTPGGDLVMVEQWRHPLQRVTLELPSGIIDPGESPEQAGIRELREETGYAGGAPECIGCLVLNPSWQTTKLYAVVIRDVRREGEKELDDAEDTRVCCIAPDEARRRVLSGEIDAAPMVSALALFSWRNGDERGG